MLDESYQRGLIRCIEHRRDGLVLTVNDETLHLPASMTNSVRLLSEGDEIVYNRRRSDNQVEDIFVKVYRKSRIGV